MIGLTLFVSRLPINRLRNEKMDDRLPVEGFTKKSLPLPVIPGCATKISKFDVGVQILGRNGG